MDILRNKFWFIFLFLFLFWCLLLLNFDWISLPASLAATVSPTTQPYGPSHDLHHDPAIKNIQETLSGDFDYVNVTTVPLDQAFPLNGTTFDHIEKNQFDAATATTALVKEDDDAMLDVETLEKEPMVDRRRRIQKPCTGRYIYVHDIPPRFNQEYVKKCKDLNKWNDMCPYFVNNGLGPDLGNPQRLFEPTGWYKTDQFALDVMFHSSMKQYECLTRDSSKAAAIYVPYYVGLDVARYLFDGHNNSVKDADALELFKWLKQRPEWEKMGGQDHFMVLGRITWDSRRVTDKEDGWGNKMMLLPESQNMTILTIESSPWDKNDFAIPYPTYFHPSTDDQVTAWQGKMSQRKRKTLFCFVGGPRPNMQNSIRGEIMQQCATATRSRCKMMECKDEKHNCLKPAYVMQMFQSSIFCLQPSGDSFTRRSTFDAIIAGCIPVFFNPGSAYVQYLWHLPKNFSSYSVLISEKDVKKRKVSIDRVLSRIPKANIAAMRAKVIELIPNVIYADPRSRLENMDDAFDLAVQGVIGRVNKIRKEAREQRTDSEKFDPEKSWQYYTFGTTKPHEWDHFFNRSQWG